MSPKISRGCWSFCARSGPGIRRKSIWAFTGYTLDGHILAQKLGPWAVTQELLTYLDVLVDGPFIAEERDLSLRFRGSRNQRLIDMKQTRAAGRIVLWTDWQSEGRMEHENAD